MTTFLLIRHALCDPVGQFISGRKAGVHLNAEGRDQARALAERLRPLALAAVYSSPLERCLETAAPVAAHHGHQIVTAPGLNELDFGDWTGLAIADLEGNPEWIDFNRFRSAARIPGGESMTEVLARALREVSRAGEAHPGQLVALISHGDVLRALVAHFLGIPLDLFQRLELSPGSVTILALESYGTRLLLLNSTGDWPTALARRSKSQAD